MIIKPILEKYYKFDDIFNLLHYDHRMYDLYDRLKKLQKKEYEPNYRFIFLHYDTDYHLKGQPGFTLRNLQRIVHSLDISNYFCLILTQKDISRDLEILRIEETTDDCTIGFIQHGLQDVLHQPKINVDLNVDAIEKTFICLNHIRRFHRTLTFSQIESKELLDQGLVSYCAYNKKNDQSD